MNEQLAKLMQIAAKDDRIVLGLMSGTSLDGLDLALCKFSGTGKATVTELLHFTTISYNQTFRNDLKHICFNPDARLEDSCRMNKQIAIEHASIILETLNQWNISAESIDILASHGQTVFHQPDSSAGPVTLQLGDGDHLATQTGIITLSDFRQKNIAAGGEGAPLAAYGDYLLFHHETEDHLLINIGGISNLTYIPANAGFEKVICTDIGPGNKLMDLWVQEHVEGMTQDTDALIASKGKVNFNLLNQLHAHPFFDLSFPKSTGPELFNMDYVLSCMHACELKELKHEDVLCTLNAFTANCIFNAVEQLAKNHESTKIFISGGGTSNPLLMNFLQNHFSSLNIPITDTNSIPADAKEAILFALLANECVAGSKEAFGEGTPAHPAISMGKISLPY